MKVQFSFSKPKLSFGSSTGFTLIEVIVSLSILIIIIASTFAVSGTYVKNQKLNSASDNLKNTLNEAKSNALSQVIRTSTCNSSLMTLRGYQVYLANATTYRLKEICADSVGTLSYPEVRTTNLESGLAFSSSTPNSINFYIQSNGGGTNFSSNEQIVISAGGSSKTVTITPDGTIK